MEACAWCGLVEGYTITREPFHFHRILAQLGTPMGDRSNDPILSQLC
jgi:hypothetical protein